MAGRKRGDSIIVNTNYSTKTHKRPAFTDLFAEVKCRLDIIEVAQHYGIQLNRNGKARCPFHQENTPSFSIKDERWHCFGACNEGGDIISLVSKLFSLSPLESAKKLNADFGLNLDMDRPTAQTVRPVDDSKRLLAAFEVWERQAFKTLCDYLSLLEHNKKVFAPQVPADLDEPHPLFVEACHKTDYIEHLTDLLIFDSFEDKLNFFKTRRDEVVNIANELKKRTSKQPA